MRRGTFGLLALLSVFVAVGSVLAVDRAEFALHPSSTEVTLLAGEQRTVTLYAESSASATSPPVELVTSPVDWRMERDGTVRYLPPGSVPGSAAAWIVSNPRTVILVPGGMEHMRITLKVPVHTGPGLYRAGILLEPQLSSRESTPVATKLHGLFRITIKVLPPRPVSK